jgi:hypothetical protein
VDMYDRITGKWKKAIRTVYVKTYLENYVAEKIEKDLIRLIAEEGLYVFEEVPISKITILTDYEKTSGVCFVGMDREKCMTYAKTDVKVSNIGHFDVRAGESIMRIDVKRWGIDYKLTHPIILSIPLEPILDLLDEYPDDVILNKSKLAVLSSNAIRRKVKKEDIVGKSRGKVIISFDDNGENIILDNSESGNYCISWYELLYALEGFYTKSATPDKLTLPKQQPAYKINAVDIKKQREERELKRKTEREEKQKRINEKWKQHTELKPEEPKESDEDVFKKYYGDWRKIEHDAI